MQDLVQRESSAPFDLERGPLLRLRVVQCVPQRRSLLAVTMHHSVGDGWSIDVLARELAALYAHFVDGGSDELPLPPLPLQYCDYAEWEAERWSASSFVGEQVAFWRAELSGGHVPALQLPLDFPRPALHTTSGVAAGVVVGAGVAERARVLAQSHGLSMFMVLDAAFQLLLWRYSNQCDFAIGAPVAGRELAEFELLIGCFVNTIVIRSAVRGGREAVSEYLARTRTRCIDALMHQATPFDRLVDELKIERDVSRSPLFQAMLVLQNAGGASVASEQLKLGSLNARALPAASAPAAKFELTLSLAERGVHDGVEGTLVANSDLLNAATTCRLARAFETTVEALVSGTAAAVSEVDVTPAEELHASAVEWNDTETPLPSAAAQDVAERVALHANEQPDCVAVIAGDDHVSYGELDRRGSAIASHLRAVGVRSGAFVALRLPRSAEMMVAIVGTLRAGAAYVPIDPLYPVARQEFMLRDSGACVVVACDSTAADQLPVVRLDADWCRGLRSGALGPPPASQLGPVYVIYTSGSTGAPKGVVVGRSGLASRISILCRRFSVTALSRVVAAFSFCFDGSVFEFFPCLWNGGCVLVLDSTIASSPEMLNRYIVETGANCFMIVVPSLLQLLLRTRTLEWDIDHIVSGAEAFNCTLLQDAAVDGFPFLHNFYGPTEASIFVTAHRISDSGSPSLSVPIGTAVAGVRLRLELSGRPTPIGAVGELFIGGTGLAHCYVNRPSLTASRFVPDCSGAPGDRLYRTGDLCRFSGAGVLDYIGRIDDQVKVRGYRIELGEVEAALRAADAAVLDAAAVVRSVGGSTQLVGFVVLAASSGVADDELARIRVAVRASLPAFMVPSALYRIDRLPLTPVGKVDRNRLLAMSDGRGTDVGGAVSPSTELEVSLARIWSSVLRAPTSSVDVSFFDMGGDSLLATQIVARIRDELCSGVDLAAIFRAPSVRGMAAQITSLREMPVQALRAADAQLPFVFLVPGADWQPHTLDALRDSLLASSNVFVAERPGDDCSDLAATAAHLAQWIGGVRSAMPSLAPTVIVGYSSGGLVAFEVARLLEGTAHAPTMCILLESFVRCGIVPSAENAEAIWAGMLARWLLPGRAPLARAAIGDLSVGARRDWFASVTDPAVAPTLDALLELHRRYVEVQSWHRTLERRAAEALVARASLVQLFTDSCPLWSLQVQADNSGGKGWLSLSGCSTRMVHVPGDHVTMLRAPHVATVGATIATLICE
jgi:amino acid adenylation domain-containing protein